MTAIPGFQWIGNNNTSGGSYVGGYPPSICLHMTVSMGLSMSYAQSHPYPPHCWANVYDGSKWQSLDLDRSGMALYQPPYTNSYLNRKYYCIQTELVGNPVVNVATYSREQCRWIGENVIAPQVQALRSIGLDINLANVRYHTDSSGSASEYWHGRMSDGEWAAFDGVCAHIDAVGNDHWDCSVEHTDWMVQDAIAFLGGGGGPTPAKGGIQIMKKALNDPKQGGNGTLYVYNEFGDCWALRRDDTRIALEDLGILEKGNPMLVSPNTFDQVLHNMGVWEDNPDKPLA